MKQIWPNIISLLFPLLFLQTYLFLFFLFKWQKLWGKKKCFLGLIHITFAVTLCWKSGSSIWPKKIFFSAPSTQIVHFYLPIFWNLLPRFMASPQYTRGECNFVYIAHGILKMKRLQKKRWTLSRLSRISAWIPPARLGCDHIRLMKVDDNEVCGLGYLKWQERYFIYLFIYFFFTF